MSEAPTKKPSSPFPRAGEQEPDSSGPNGWVARSPASKPAASFGNVRPTVLVSGDGSSATSAPIWGHLLGLALIAIAALAGTAPEANWLKVTAWAGAFWASETGRLFVVLALMMTGVSFLPCRPFVFLVTSGLFGFAFWCMNALADGRPEARIAETLGADWVNRALVLGSLAAGYSAHAAGRTNTLTVRGVGGFLLIALAGLGTVKGWYDWPRLAGLLGHGAPSVLKQWSEECTWAAVLLLTAIGVASSQTKPVQFLCALVLAALAYHCVRGGYVEMRSFPDLAREGGPVPSVESITYANVAAWRWIVAAELVCLGAVLLHMSLGIGGLSLAFAIGWMSFGLSVYDRVGMMSLVKSGSHVLAAGIRESPLANMGLPIGAPPAGKAFARPPGTGQGPTNDGVEQVLQDRDFQLRAAVLEATPLAWMIVTATLAGLVAAGGLRMLTQRQSPRVLVFIALWASLIAGVCCLIWVWPRNPGQSWNTWLANWRYCRYHQSAIWLAFLAATAMAWVWAMEGQAITWATVGVVASFLGTVATLGATMVMIRLGGFPPLPTWVYIVMVAGQSLLAWILLLHVAQSGRRSTTQPVVTQGN